MSHALGFSAIFIPIIALIHIYILLAIIVDFNPSFTVAVALDFTS